MKSKWLFTSLFFLAFCMSAYGIQVSAPDLEAQPGDAITVEVSVDDATGIAGADFNLVYDPAILAATDARLTELGTGLIPSDPNLTVAGQVTMAIMGLQGIAEGSGAFIEVDFDVLPDASGVSPLDLSAIALYDELGEDLPVEVVNGSVTVAGVEPSPEEANKAFISEYLEALSGKEKPAEVVDQYVSDEDQVLKQHIVMFEAGFPLYELIADDMIAEGDKVAVRATFHGVHKGEFAGVPPTDVEATMTVNITYRIAEGKIVEHWIEADQLGLMQQLGAVPDGRESYDWGAPSEIVGDPGDPEANKALVLSIVEIWNQQDLDMVDELVSPDFVNHNPASGPPEVGIDAYKQSIVTYTTAFPDLLITVDDMVAEGDKVAKRWTATGTHQGELSGIPPLGTAVTFTGITIYRFADGKLVENWWAWDTLGLMQQITPPEVPVTEANKAIVVREFEEVWNQQNLDVIDEIYSPDNIFHDPAETGFMGPEGYRQFATIYITAFPDVQFTIEEQIAAGDKVATLWTATGTHKGELMGIPPTDVFATTVGINIAQIADGQIVEEWAHWDALGQMQQLGVITPARPAPENYMWGAPSGVVGEAGDPEANKAVVMRSIEEVWNQGNLDVLDEISSPDHVGHSPVELTSPMIGIEAAKAGIAVYLAAFPDLKITIEDIFAAGDMVVARWSSTGTHEGELAGIPPTGKETESTGILISRVVDGLITDSWWAWDALGLMQQITPTEPEPTLPEIILASLAVSDAAVNSQDPDLLVSISADDQVYDYVPMPPPIEGKEAIKEFFTGIFQTFPDLSVTLIRPPLVAGDIAVVEHTMTGTHLGELDLGPMGIVPPTEKSFQNIHMDIWDFEDGKVKKATTYDDMASQLMQLGILPAAEMPELVPSFTLPDPEPNPGISPLDMVADSLSRINTGDMALYSKIFHQDAEIVLAPFVTPINRDQFIAAMELYFLAFPDLLHEAVRTVDMGDGWALMEYVASGNNTGPYFGIPATNKFSSVRGAVISQIDEDGLITYMAAYYDSLTIMANLGLLAPEEPPTKDYSNKFYMSVTSGLNMISLPLEPEVPYTARSFAEEIGATLVIRYDEVLKEFEGFALNAPGDGFILEGGRGYIVNMLESKVVEFTGAAWANEPPVEAAPPAAQAFSAWAFLVNGTVMDGEDMSLSDSDYTVVVKNLRTGAIADETVGEEGYFAAVWADLSRKAVIEAGDKVEVAVVDSSGKVASGPFVHDITLDGIRNALVKVQLRLGDIIPEKSALLQNYPNPFNPETWIPFHLRGEASVSIRIFSLSGQLIKTLDLGHRDAGVYVSRARAAYWDGRNEAGEEVSSGIYFYSISAGDFSATKKMIIRK